MSQGIGMLNFAIRATVAEMPGDVQRNHHDAGADRGSSVTAASAEAIGEIELRSAARSRRPRADDRDDDQQLRVEVS
jgi:hypothetical protein